MSRDKDDEVALDMLIDIAAEQPPKQRQIADDRCAIFDFLHIFANQTAEHDRLTIPYAHACRYLAAAKDGLVNNVVGESHRIRNRDPSSGVNTNGIDRASIVDEAFELDHLRNEIQIDRHSIRPDDRFYLQGDAGISSLKVARSAGCSDCRNGSSAATAANRNIRQLRRSEFGR